MISSLWCVGSSGLNFSSGISARNSQNLQMKYAKMRRLLPSAGSAGALYALANWLDDSRRPACHGLAAASLTLIALELLMHYAKAIRWLRDLPYEMTDNWF